MDKQAFELRVLRLMAEDAERRPGNVAWVNNFDTLGDIQAWAFQAGRRARALFQVGRSAIALALAASASAVTPVQPQRLARSVRVTAENDYFDFWRRPGERPDDNYTQGARVAVDLTAPPPVIRPLLCGTRSLCGSSLEVGQEMYTPTYDSAQPVPGERPYAGWLYARGIADAVTPRRRRSLELTIGVTGPASLAAQTQEAFHHWVPGFRRPLGWSNQLPTELAGALRLEGARYLARTGGARRWADVVPAAHLTLGTLRTAVGVSARARVGIDLAHPWLVDAGTRWWEAYLLLGVQAEAVGRDLFLDGSTFRRSVHVTHQPVVGDWERGAGVRLGRLSLEYRADTRSREYRTGPVTHTFGAMSISWWVTR